MEKTWKCGGCAVLYFTRAAVVKHISEAHGNDPSVKPTRTRQASKPTPGPVRSEKPAATGHRNTQLKICRSSKEVKELLWNNSSGYTIVLHPAMTSLNLSNVSAKASKLAAILSNSSSNLTSLNVSGTNLGDSGLKLLTEALQCSSLSLRHFNIAANDITSNGLKYILRLLHRTPLRTLDLGKNSFAVGSTLINMFRTYPSITSCSVSGVPAESPEAVADLASMLKENTTLCHLDISGINLSKNQAVSLGEALKVNQHINSLSLLGEMDPNEGGVVPIFHALQCNTSLQTLIFWCQQRSGYNEAKTTLVMKEIYTSLVANKHLTSLSLFSPKRKEKVTFGGEGMKLISDLLKENHTLKVLSITSDDKEEDTSCIAEALQTNTTLTTLDLHCNAIDLAAFANSLSQHPSPSLASLHLSHSRDFFFQYFITPSEGWSVETACNIARSCKNLRSLDVPVYVDTPTEVERVLALLWHNSRITHFNINFDRLNSYNKETMKYYRSTGVLEDFIVDSRTSLLQDLLAINNSIHYGWIEFKELAAGLAEDPRLPDSSPLAGLDSWIILHITRYCRELHLLRKKNHFLITWWAKEMLAAQPKKFPK